MSKTHWKCSSHAQKCPNNCIAKANDIHDIGSAKNIFSTNDDLCLQEMKY